MEDEITFGPFRYARRTGHVLRLDTSGVPRPIPLGARAREILVVLLDHAGEVVSRQQIIETVWKGVIVEDKNLAVQMSALRRALDEGRTSGSCIETVPGRGYRFVEPVFQAPTVQAATPAPGQLARHYFSRSLRVWLAFTAIMLILATVSGWNFIHSFHSVGLPRFSLVVLPFQDLSENPQDRGLAASMTTDLTVDLARDPQATVVSAPARNSQGAAASDPERVGQTLGVRYAVAGQIHRSGLAVLRVDVEIISVESGAQMWSDRVDEVLDPEGRFPDRIVNYFRTKLRDALIGIEAARVERDHPANPDAFDLVIKARATTLQSVQASQQRHILDLYELALAQNPSYLPALTNSAYFLVEYMSPWQRFSDMRLAEVRLAQARAIAPHAVGPAYTQLYWLKSVGRCPEVIELGQHLISTDPQGSRSIPGIYSQVGQCLSQAGRAEEDITFQEQAIEIEPRTPWIFDRYRSIGYDQLLLGRDQDAIANLRRSLDLNPSIASDWRNLLLAAAYSRTGEGEKAHVALAEAIRRWPWFTVRMVSPNSSQNATYQAQLQGVQEALRHAGLRDHADEFADFGVASDDKLHLLVGPTSLTAPGVVTILTTNLRDLLEQQQPTVIDTVNYSWGRSIPGAIGLAFAGLGGDLTDEAQDRLRMKMHDLLGDNRGRSIVAVGWNSERFDGRNLALRLRALGYQHVYWYRGGREAWEAAGLPETDIKMEQW